MWSVFMRIKTGCVAGIRHGLICLIESVISIVVISESLLGILQILGFRQSRHIGFVLTGHFDNPGPYGGFLAVCLAVTIAYCVTRYKDITNPTTAAGFLTRVPAFLSVIASLFGIVLLPATMSRAAWLSLLAAIVVMAIHYNKNRGVKIKKKYFIAFVTAIALLGTGAFVMKKDSALGRLHIWRMEIRAMGEYPLAGSGSGSVLGAYGRAQQAFFALKERPEMVKRIAGCPEYAFNEYLKVGVENGIPAMLVVIVAAILAVFVLLRAENPLAYGLIALEVFAFFSYPLSLWQFRLLAALFFVAALIEGCCLFRCWGRSGYLTIVTLGVIAGVIMLVVKSDKCREYASAKCQWQFARQLSSLAMYEDAVLSYEPLYDKLKGDYRYLYDYGYGLFQLEEYDRSLEILSQGANISSDPMFHNIMGRCYEAKKDYYAAEAEYFYSHNMVPGRIYPLVLLMEMYHDSGQDNKAKKIYSEILRVQVNPRNALMIDLRKRADDIWKNELAE